MHYRRVHKPTRLPNVEQTVWALAETIIGDHAATPVKDEVVGAVTHFVLEVRSGMPDYLRLAFRLLTLLFDLWAYPTSGGPFHALDLERRRAQIEAWEKSRLEARRGFITFYRSFAIYGFYSERYGAELGGGRE